MKDPRQGAAAIVFLIFYACAAAFLFYCLFTRRAKRYLISATSFTLIRLGANVAALGWAIHLYDNFDWLIASLILGSEGYFALVLCVLFVIVGYEKETFGKSVFYPDRPDGRNKCLHRLTHISFWFEQSLIPANVLLVVGGSLVSGGLANADSAQLLDPRSIPKVKLGQTLRIIGQTLFFAAIIAGYVCVWTVYRKATRLGKDKTALKWLAASCPFLLIRGAYGIVSSADWSYSYYIPDNYGPNGLKTKELIVEYLLGITTEALALIFLLRAIWLTTMPKALFVPYDQRPKPEDDEVHNTRMDEEALKRNGTHETDGKAVRPSLS